MKRPSFATIVNSKNIKIITAVIYVGLCAYLGYMVYNMENKPPVVPPADTAGAIGATEQNDQLTVPETFPARSADRVRNPGYLPNVRPKERFETDGLTDLEKHYTYDNKIIPRKISLY